MADLRLGVNRFGNDNMLLESSEVLHSLCRGITSSRSTWILVLRRKFHCQRKMALPTHRQLDACLHSPSLMSSLCSVALMAPTAMREHVGDLTPISCYFLASRILTIHISFLHNGSSDINTVSTEQSKGTTTCQAALVLEHHAPHTHSQTRAGRVLRRRRTKACHTLALLGQKRGDSSGLLEWDKSGRRRLQQDHGVLQASGRE